MSLSSIYPTPSCHHNTNTSTFYESFDTFLIHIASVTLLVYSVPSAWHNTHIASVAFCLFNTTLLFSCNTQTTFTSLSPWLNFLSCLCITRSFYYNHMNEYPAPQQQRPNRRSNGGRRRGRSNINTELDSNEGGLQQERTTRQRYDHSAEQGDATRFNPPPYALHPVTPATRNSSGDSTTPPSSIRINARNAAVGLGIRSGRAFERNYRHTQTRVCYCDQPMFPAGCELCTSSFENGGVPCNIHTVVPCSFPGCGWVAHSQCLESFGHSFDNAPPSFRCLKHSSTGTDNSHVNSFTSWESCSLEGKCRRMGMAFDSTLSHRAMQNRLKKCIDSLQTSNVPLSLVNTIKNSDPVPYPDIVRMNVGNNMKSALCGRRFEISMLQYITRTCSCCGFTCPTHSDPFYTYQSDDALRRAHLIMTFHEAWECNCTSVCSGQQFYGARRTSN
jgi:hypothetical protein